jgi:tetratricopeptide (TPR) repeat protein
MDYDRLRELQEKFEENPRRYFAPLANEYRKGGQPKRAIEICRSQLSQMPGHMSGQIVYGQALYETGEFEEARLVFERALMLDPENLIALRSLGDMSLQSGNTVEARKWYMRLLDADPKDAPVIALVSEIDASTDAKPIPTPKSVPGIDADEGDQAITFIADAEGAPVVAKDAAPEPPAQTAAQTALSAAFESAPPLRQVESELPTAPVSASEPEPRAAEVLGQTPPAGLERHYPTEQVDAGQPDEGMGAEGLRGGRKDELMGAEGLLGTEPETPPEPVGAEGLSGKAPPQALAGTTSKRSDDEDALDTWTPPPDVAAPERVESPRAEPPRAESPRAESPRTESPRAESPKEERMFSGPGPEPVVNETMAQLYLQQGYRQLALRVYYQLAESRPDDQTLKARIKEIEAADHAAHPDSPVPAQAAPSRESVETPRRDEPRASEDIAARQPSIREFFATLGRRRPPRSAGNPGGSSRPGNNIPSETVAPMGSSAPSASLDAVFAGATVSASDSRAASRLAGAFSGTAGSPRTTPPTPPVPTPRVNARMPQTQESEEDVAKFRAWLDGLTGE